MLCWESNIFITMYQIWLDCPHSVKLTYLEQEKNIYLFTYSLWVEMTWNLMESNKVRMSRFRQVNPVWLPFWWLNCLIICGIDSANFQKHLSEIWIHIYFQGSQNPHWVASLHVHDADLPLPPRWALQRRSTGLRCSDRGRRRGRGRVQQSSLRWFAHSDIVLVHKISGLEDTSSVNLRIG